MQLMKNFSGYIMALVAILVVILVSIFWTIPELQKYLASNKDAEEEQERIAQFLEPKRDVLQKTSEAELNTLVENVRNAVPEKLQPVYVLAFIEELGALSGVSVKDPVYVYADIQEEKVLVLSASVVGDFDTITVFFENLSNTAPLLRVLQLSFNREAVDENEEGVLYDYTAQFIVESPFLPLPETLGSFEAEIEALSPAEKQLVLDIANKIKPGDSTTLLPEEE
jgi:hypothetical protein